MQATVQFTKMQGTGNDFIIVCADDIRPLQTNLSANAWVDFVKRICDRHFGIGADGLMVASPAEEGGVKMEYYNADGSAAAFCGNGARCIARYASLKGWIESEDYIHAAIGSVPCRVLPEGDVSIHMPDTRTPKFVASETSYFIDTGVPHLVKEIKFSSDEAFLQWAKPRSEASDLFPGGVNVNTYHYDNACLHVRTYELGVYAETLSCGTGVVATALTAAYLVDMASGTLKVYTRGGRLSVSFAQGGYKTRYQDIWLTGPAERIAEGVFYYNGK